MVFLQTAWQVWENIANKKDGLTSQIGGGSRKLFDEFPFLEGENVLLHKMAESDVDALMEITGSKEVYRFIPPFLYQKKPPIFMQSHRQFKRTRF